MPLERPTLETLIERITSDVFSKFGVSVSGTPLRRSVLKVLSRTIAGSIHLLYGRLDEMVQNIFPDTAVGVYLDRWGTFFKVIRQVGVKSSGTVTMTGVVGSNVPVGVTFRRADSLEYISTETASQSIPAGGTLSIDVEATVAGEDWDTDTGTELTFISPLSGINSTVTVDAPGLADGVDLEADDVYRIRILRKIQTPPYGGAEHDYALWAFEAASYVTRAWGYPRYDITGASTEDGVVALAFVTDDKGDYPDRIANGTFTSNSYWTLDAKWSIADGKVTHATGTADGFEQTIGEALHDSYGEGESLVDSRSYKIVYTITDWTAGTVKPVLGGTNGTSEGQNDTIEETLAAGASDDKLIFEATTDFDGSISNVQLYDLSNQIQPDDEEILFVQSYVDTLRPVGLKEPPDGFFCIRLGENITNFTFTTILPNTDAVKAAVEAELLELFKEKGSPGETIYISQIREAVSRATDEENYVMTAPSADVVIGDEEVAVLGTITWP